MVHIQKSLFDRIQGHKELYPQKVNQKKRQVSFQSVQSFMNDRAFNADHFGKNI